jgi:hypothetical protein
MGREAYQNPYILAQVDNLVFGENHAVPSRHEVVRMMLPYIEQELAKGNYLSHMTRHMLGLFQNMQGARAWRRHLSENACKPGPTFKWCWTPWPRCRSSRRPTRWSDHVPLHGSWLHKALVRLCAGLLTILGIKLSAFYFIGLLIVLGLHRDQILG